jgi:RNA-directed DNA polymerase
MQGDRIPAVDVLRDELWVTDIEHREALFNRVEVRDHRRRAIVQASLKLVLEPVFEADFHPCSYGFRPNRRAREAIAEIHYLASDSRAYHWVFEGDIEACFDEISHRPLWTGTATSRGQTRSVPGESVPQSRDSLEGCRLPGQYHRNTAGWILSPLLSNIALSVLDEHFAAKWKANAT